MNFTPQDHPVQRWKRECRRACTATEPMENTLHLKLVFVLPRPKAMFWKRKEMPRVAHGKKPDLDNLVKAVKDALTGVLYVDDSLVWSLLASKMIAAGDEDAHLIVTAIEEVT